jgi:tRNA U34 5-methylaminomethyl-2-thiouridine-forming methyltransferase MnmC
VENSPLVEIRISEDGSHTLYLPAIDETYHSIHGAINESRHVFLDAGLSLLDTANIRVLEIGFGTGLNALLTAQYATDNNIKIEYSTIEKFPLQESVWAELNYGQVIGQEELFQSIHKAAWGIEKQISPDFTLLKLEADLNHLSLHSEFDRIFFDAFSPEKQPDLWTEAVFEQMYTLTAKDGILTTYCAKGAVRRAMQAAGYIVERIPGPIGKREMLRARKV